MHKCLIGFASLAGALIGAATLVADERPWDRSPSQNLWQQPTIPSISGTVPMADAEGLEAPPPAPGIEGAVPPGPMPAPSQPLPPSVQPVPATGPAAAGGPPVVMAPGVALYPRVRYHDKRHIAPCAVPMVVAARDPCAGKDPCSSCGPPKCVLVEICVPPCGCPKICVKHDGAKVRYDYGKYAVNITSRHGVVVVHYDG
ncbi:MAG TPA: hypothetical protein VEI07_20355 [Planctomycetaceae bacterium]|nr:hypothetical protein [Planctomycetaceae bacterium]